MKPRIPDSEWVCEWRKKPKGELPDEMRHYAVCLTECGYVAGGGYKGILYVGGLDFCPFCSRKITMVSKAEEA